MAPSPHPQTHGAHRPRNGYCIPSQLREPWPVTGATPRELNLHSLRLTPLEQLLPKLVISHYKCVL